MTTLPLPRAGLPEGEAAATPPERRGVARDRVRMLVAGPSRLEHDVFRNLAAYLQAGDVVVVNTSATRAAAVDGLWRGDPVTLHLSSRLDAGEWVVEIRQPDGSGPVRDALPGEVLRLAGGGQVVLVGPYLGSRLWTARLRDFDAAAARPISYGYTSGAWPLADYQTIFSRPDDPTGASAEMPSAGRPFSHPMVTELVTGGIGVHPVALHTGVSSLERHEPPPPERFRVPATTAAAVDAARGRGGRVVAVGTTVTRALESSIGPDGRVAARDGWTDLVLGPERPGRVVSGLVTGWHPPDASHLLLLEAVAGRRLVEEAYRAASDHAYLWHEFGDACLLLP